MAAFDYKNRVAEIPHKPGVYQYYDEAGTIIYIGKAINLKKAPYWHHAAGLPSWIFADEIIIN